MKLASAAVMTLLAHRSRPSVTLNLRCGIQPSIMAKMAANKPTTTACTCHHTKITIADAIGSRRLCAISSDELKCGSVRTTTEVPYSTLLIVKRTRFRHTFA